MAYAGRPPVIAIEDRLTVIDPSPARAALPAGHTVTWSLLQALTPRNADLPWTSRPQ